MITFSTKTQQTLQKFTEKSTESKEVLNQLIEDVLKILDVPINKIKNLVVMKVILVTVKSPNKQIYLILKGLKMKIMKIALPTYATEKRLEEKRREVENGSYFRDHK